MNQVIATMLPPHMSKEEVHKIFSRFGLITDYKFTGVGSGAPFGTACITYQNPSSACKAIELDETMMDGSKIRVYTPSPSGIILGKKQTIVDETMDILNRIKGKGLL
ncbi:uncharacterized protein MONOS_10963 [Monocercomonoides exilis]|uniref:uncharacterized protein n=1 Tax=Monocercomonoides exilis TaxID=2049356 RepID=UPI00355979AA|nr:hypothetical protein MONOS_10963 [Monocercomonoides exilis]|eukprot:MONOS_10963.1-p1 / transcript=MONOS_10963.1 / gene=MONOS_10963 / organism=Monocercomonoides_exilis_PA203 / gene_product=unspecified product / transcript_product=unspecified product / location=Mono_scaffold00522:31101-31486(+) / protein_length=106 / sequence_SO=supercontig / SO=protein_coding / is_pseudo=false